MEGIHISQYFHTGYLDVGAHSPLLILSNGALSQCRAHNDSDQIVEWSQFVDKALIRSFLISILLFLSFAMATSPFFHFHSSLCRIPPCVPLSGEEAEDLVGYLPKIISGYL